MGRCHAPVATSLEFQHLIDVNYLKVTYSKPVSPSRLVLINHLVTPTNLRPGVYVS